MDLNSGVAKSIFAASTSNDTKSSSKLTALNVPLVSRVLVSPAIPSSLGTLEPFLPWYFSISDTSLLATKGLNFPTLFVLKVMSKVPATSTAARAANWFLIC